MSAVSTLVEPAHSSVPTWRHTAGPEVCDLAALAGRAPDAEQAMILDALFATGPDGRSAAYEAAIICARQNLKTSVIELAALGWLFITDQRLVVWSAHEFNTTRESFRNLELLCTAHPSLRRQVKGISRGAGTEAIELHGDRRIVFRARTRSGGRGLSGDRVVLDEAFALRADHMGALVPTLSARPDPQLVYGSSAAKADSTVLHDIVERGRAGNDARMAYFEWCAPDPGDACAKGKNCTHGREVVGCGCDNLDLLRLANPALGRRIMPDTIRSERRALPPPEFARERMGWHDELVRSVTPITEEKWCAGHDSASSVLDPVALGVDVTPDRSMGAVAIAGRRSDGRWHGELVEHRAGTGWVIARLVELARRHGPCVLVIDTTSPAGSLLQPLLDAGFVEQPRDGQWQLHCVSGREYAQACGALVDDINNDAWRHLGQGPLDDAAKGAVTRPLADAFGWARRHSGVDISPLVAVTLARLGHAMYATAKTPEPFALWGDR